MARAGLCSSCHVACAATPHATRGRACTAGTYGAAARERERPVHACAVRRLQVQPCPKPIPGPPPRCRRARRARFATPRYAALRRTTPRYAAERHVAPLNAAERHAVTCRPDCPLATGAVAPCATIPGNVLDAEAYQTGRPCTYHGASGYGAIASGNLRDWQDVSRALPWLIWAALRSSLSAGSLVPVSRRAAATGTCQRTLPPDLPPPLMLPQVSHQISGLGGAGTPPTRHKHGTAVQLRRAALCGICAEADRTGTRELWIGSGVLERCEACVRP